MTMHACERARARYLNDRVRCKMSTVAPKASHSVLWSALLCGARAVWYS